MNFFISENGIFKWKILSELKIFNHMRHLNFDIESTDKFISFIKKKTNTMPFISYKTRYGLKYKN